MRINLNLFPKKREFPNAQRYLYTDNAIISRLTLVVTSFALATTAVASEEKTKNKDAAPLEAVQELVDSFSGGKKTPQALPAGQSITEDKRSAQSRVAPKVSGASKIGAEGQQSSISAQEVSTDNFVPDFDTVEGRGPAVVADDDVKKNGYYKPTRAYRLEPEYDVPAYARKANETYKELSGIDWLNVGLDTRVRFEDRQNDYRPWVDTSVNPPTTTNRRYYTQPDWLSRTRLYAGVKSVIDPLRFVIELQDSRAFNTIYQQQANEVNQTDMLQGYGELFFKDAFGKDGKGQDRALSIRAGRMAFELGARRLIARNEFRNTTNNFDGFRVKIGQKENDFDIDSFLMRPVIINPYNFDRPDWQNWIYGSWISIHKWSDVVTVQPYFIGRHQYADPLNPLNAYKIQRDTQAPGLRLYGSRNGFDYDLDVMKQFGTVGSLQYLTSTSTSFNLQKTLQQDAISYAADVGYTFESHPWKPRISAVYVYGSGTKNPFGGTNNSVDTFFGFDQPFSRSGYINWSNVKDPKARIEFEPWKGTQIDASFSAYWLASAAASWEKVSLWSPVGNRGTFMGTEVDLRIRQKISQFINISLSYDRFMPGSFTSSFAPPTAQQWPPVNWPGQTWPGQTGSTNGVTARPTDFFYLEVYANAFGDGKSIKDIPGREFMATWNEDAPEPKRPSWTDVYVGLNGGGAWSSPTMTVQDAAWGGKTIATQSQAIAQSTLNLLPSNYTNRVAGFLGGFQMGANWNFAGNAIAGVEADLDGTTGNTNNQQDIANALASGKLYTTFAQHMTSLTYLGTVRGKLGYLLFPTVEVYGTGGLAVGGVLAANNYASITVTTPTSPKIYGPQYQGNLVGWAAGGGVEWMFIPNWSAKVDYLYYDLGSVSAGGPYSSVTWAPYVTTTNYATSTSFGSVSHMTAHFSGNVVRAGINKHFDVAGVKGVLSK